MTSEPQPHRTKYQQLADTLRDRLRSYPGGGRLPSVRALMKRFRVSQHTVVSALRLLENDDLISRRHGSGVYRNDINRLPIIAYCRPDTASPEIDMRSYSLRVACEKRKWKLAIHRFDPAHVDIFADDIHADAFIIQPEMVTFHSPLLGRLAEHRTPCVAMGRDTGGVNLDFCVGDDVALLTELVKGLADRGHRRLALLVSEPHFYEIEGRIKVFKQLCQFLDLEYFEILDVRAEYGHDSLVQSDKYFREFLQNLPSGRLPFTALITCSPCGSIPALRALHDAGFKVPADCSLCCMGSDAGAQYSIPSITNARSHYEEMSEACLRILEKRINGDSSPLLSELIIYPPCWRESAGRAPGA